jgi:hypothetical protein
LSLLGHGTKLKIQDLQERTKFARGKILQLRIMKLNKLKEFCIYLKNKQDENSRLLHCIIVIRLLKTIKIAGFRATGVHL